MSASAAAIAVLAIATASVQGDIQQRRRRAYEWQSATPYTDPDSLCAAGATGYRATSDCKGYVFCNNGYLMGGGEAAEQVGSVFPCWNGQLFDEGMGACTPTGGSNCRPASKPKPSPPSPKPPTKRPTRRPVTRRPTRRPTTYSDVEPPPSGAGATARPPPSAGTILEETLTGYPPPTNWPTRRPTPQPTEKPAFNNPPPATANKPYSNPAPVTANKAEEDSWGLTNDEFLFGKLRSSYFCGARWGNLQSADACNAATPCPSGLHDDCPAGQNCFSDTPCDELRAPPPPAPKFEGDPNKRFCGYDWRNVISNCLTATPCPGGFAQGVCPEGMLCMADTFCSDENYLAHLTNGGDPASYDGSVQVDMQNNPSPTVAVAAKPAGPSIVGSVVGAPGSPTASSTNIQCRSDYECPFGEFCNPEMGYRCGDCLLSNGMGCSTEQICRLSSCGGEHGLPECYNTALLHEQCKTQFNDPRAKCDTRTMKCESRQPQQTIDSNIPNNMGVAAYANPPENTYFCGTSHGAITRSCLNSKPCPGGFASAYCASNEGCFIVPSCTAEYVSSSVSPPPTPRPSKPPTNPPMPNPTPNPSRQPTNIPTPNQADSTPSFPAPTKKPTLAPFINLIQKPSPSSPTTTTQQQQTASKPAPFPIPTQRPTPLPTPPVLSALFPDSSLTAPVASSNTNDDVNSFESSESISASSPGTNQPMDAAAAPNNPMPSEACGLCEGSPLDSSQSVLFGGSILPCGEFGGIFRAEGIREGSERCINFRGQYASACCSTASTTTDDGTERCSLCIDSALNSDATVFFAGQAVSCYQLEDEIFVDEGVAAGSSRCEVGRNYYSGACCAARTAAQAATEEVPDASQTTLADQEQNEPPSSPPSQASFRWNVRSPDLLSPAPKRSVLVSLCMLLVGALLPIL